jgi:hypothetical protein
MITSMSAELQINLEPSASNSGISKHQMLCQYQKEVKLSLFLTN